MWSSVGESFVLGSVFVCFTQTAISSRAGMLVISISLIEADVDNLTRGIKGFPVTPDKQMQCEKRMCGTLQMY